MHRAVVGFSILLLLCAGLSLGQEPLDQYGGWTQVRSAATQWFRVARLDGRWWFINPQGNAFLSLGVDGVSPPPQSARYRNEPLTRLGGRREWAASSLQRLRTWGFNTVGANSDRVTWQGNLPYTVALNLSGRFRLRESQEFPDVFSPAYAREVQAVARRLCRPLAGDPWLLGYFSDDDLPWGSSAEGLLSQFLRLHDHAPGRAAFLRFLEDRYLQIEELNEVWGTTYAAFAEVGRVPQVGASIPAPDQEDFARLVAARYFSTAQRAIRAVDTHHLLLGCRFSAPPPAPVLRAMADHVNVVSLRAYGEHPPAAALREMHRLTSRPLLLLATFPAPVRGETMEEVETQKERGSRYARYHREAMALPMVIGCHWDTYAHAAGEDDENPGLVSPDGEPYPDFVAAVTAANHGAYACHARGKPCATTEPK